MKKRFCLLLALAALFLCACGQAAAPGAAPSEPQATQTTPENVRRAEITVRDYGTIELELYEDAAPITVAHFCELAQAGFYDGLTFHRVMEGFMIQGGAAPVTERIKGEFSKNGVDNPISHVRGVISMARGNDYDSASSQFFITVADSTFLDGNYAAFGRVTEGMDVVDRIVENAHPVDDNGKLPPEEQPVIESIVILN